MTSAQDCQTGQHGVPRHIGTSHKQLFWCKCALCDIWDIVRSFHDFPKFTRLGILYLIWQLLWELFFSLGRYKQMSAPSRAPTINQNRIPPKSSLGNQQVHWVYLQNMGEGLLRGAWVVPKQLLLLESLTPV